MVFILLSLVMLVPVQAAEQEHTYRIGITAFRDKAVTSREWGPTMDFLSSAVPGARFVAVPATLPDLELALSKNELDFVITNPEHYIIMEAKYGMSRVATLAKSEGGNLVNRFGGVIFCRSDRSDINRLADVKGKVIAATDRTSFAAFLLQYDLLEEHGVDIDKVSQLEFLGFPQDLNVKAVLERRADVGFVRTGVLEAMSNEGRIQLSDIRVLNASAPVDFPFLLSTALFPEWPLAASPHVPFDVKNQVVAALLLMQPDSPAATSAHYSRWSTPVEYLSVQSLMRRHHIYPFDKAENITLWAILNQYLVYIVAGLFVVICALILLYIRAYRLNRELQASRLKLSEMAHHDALTGLPNRNLLADRLDQALVHAKRSGDDIAVCLLDLDGFKPINDRFGHKVGDEVLQEVAHRLKAILRECDTVARYGGDEFVLLLNGFPEGVILNDVMGRVLSAIARPFDFAAGAHVTASIGVSHYPDDALAAQDLFKHADEAMYVAKKNGGNRFAVYLPYAMTVAADPAGGDAVTNFGRVRAEDGLNKPGVIPG